jgi:hypothetical protein
MVAVETAGELADQLRTLTPGARSIPALSQDSGKALHWEGSLRVEGGGLRCRWYHGLYALDVDLLRDRQNIVDLDA